VLGCSNRAAAATAKAQSAQSRSEERQDARCRDIGWRNNAEFLDLPDVIARDHRIAPPRPKVELCVAARFLGLKHEGVRAISVAIGRREGLAANVARAGETGEREHEVRIGAAGEAAEVAGEARVDVTALPAARAVGGVNRDDVAISHRVFENGR